MSVLSDLSKCLYPPKAATVLNSSPTTCTLPISLAPQNISDISNTYRKICCLFHLLLKMKIKMYAEFFFFLFHNYTDLENRTAIFNFGPATGFKSQYPTRHAIYPYIFYPVIAHLKKSHISCCFPRLIYMFSHI